LRRVAVVGTSCSGKTTLAAALARTLGCDHVELDALHWLPDWVERPTEEFRELTEDAVAGECWTVDGNYSRVRDLVWERATHVVWLNYGFPVVFFRALRRTLRRVATREELYSGNRESFQLAFLDRDSILWWVITTWRRRRRTYRELCTRENFPHVEFIELRHPRDADALLARLEGPR
jgi:adenylate kinase family enzyme